MNSDLSSFLLLRDLWIHINRRRRWQFALVFLLMLVASFSEVLSIGAVLPFLSALTSPERIYELPLAQPVIRFLDLNDPIQLLLPLTVIFGLGTLLAGVLRLALLWASTRLSFATGADISSNIYRRTLYQPYLVHCTRNSSEVIDGIANKANAVIYTALMPALALISSCIMLFSILATLLMIAPFISLIAFIGIGLIYFFIIKITRNQLMIDSKCIARESTQIIKSLQEGLGGIRDILIDGSQEIYCDIYSKADLPKRRAEGNVLFIGASPRYAMEALGMLLIAGLAYSMSQQTNGISLAIPILGALALGAQRLLPVLQQAYLSWTQIQGGKSSLKDALDLLNQPLPQITSRPVEQISFRDHIALKDISFRYSELTPYVLKQLNLKIIKGSRVGFIGTTGGGKSTLLDIVMGLLEPTAGILKVDGLPITFANQRSWQDRIAHVPQSIFLADSTVEENIAFGVPKEEINTARVKWAAEQAQILAAIESWPKQYQTFIGERGIRLSGGQRQRLGIARALYKHADVIIFDEATSALDSTTEQAVMESIERLSNDLTILIIAHRISTLKKCNIIYEVSNGFIREV